MLIDLMMKTMKRTRTLPFQVVHAAVDKMFHSSLILVRNCAWDAKDVRMLMSHVNQRNATIQQDVHQPRFLIANVVVSDGSDKWV